MVREQSKGTKLEVFSGRQARLNVIIFLVLYSKKLLSSYDIYLEIKRIKGYRHTRYQSIDRRVKALYQQGWLKKDGIRLAKAHFLLPLYALSIRARAALAISKTDLNVFIHIAPESKLEIIIDVLSVNN